MCGICGVCYADPSANVDASLLTSMRDAITHRGPDDEGYFVQGQVSLGMRRLSIIDVEGGKQPIHNEDSTIQIVYNGEIYNYIELKRELEGLGHRFYTRSDTEVIVHAYEAYGTSCLSKLRGMFALALWDARRQELVLAVDRFGIKPLFYTVNQQYIAFGSELKCLLAAGLVQRELDVEALAEYFRIGAVAAPATIFRGARKLPPGTFLRWNRHSAATVRQYWDVPVDRIDRSRPLAETRRQLRAVLRDAVRSHLVSDVA